MACHCPPRTQADTYKACAHSQHVAHSPTHLFALNVVPLHGHQAILDHVKHHTPLAMSFLVNCTQAGSELLSFPATNPPVRHWYIYDKERDFHVCARMT